MALFLAESWNGYGGNTTQLARRWPTGTGTLTSAQAKTGTYSLGGGGASARVRPITPGSSIFAGMWVYWTGTVPFDAAFQLCSLSTGNDGFSRHCGFQFDTSHRILALGINGSTLGTSAACLNTNAWNYIVAKFLAQDAGTVTIYCNDPNLVTPVLNVSGDCRSASYSFFTQSVSLGVTSSTTNYLVGPVWILDSTGSAPYNTYLTGEQLVTAFNPTTGNGANTGFTPSTGSDHGALVDEATANDDTDYNAGGSAGVKDTYLFNTSALAGKTINGVSLNLCSKATTAGTNTIAGVARIGGTDYDGTTRSITTSYAYYEQLWGPRPSDSAAWTQADVAEFGMKAVATAGANRLTQLYIDVLHAATGSAGAFNALLIAP